MLLTSITTAVLLLTGTAAAAWATKHGDMEFEGNQFAIFYRPKWSLPDTPEIPLLASEVCHIFPLLLPLPLPLCLQFLSLSHSPLIMTFCHSMLSPSTHVLIFFTHSYKSTPKLPPLPPPQANPKRKSYPISAKTAISSSRATSPLGIWV